jgi:diguanylate cyclase (GGDEF)-like protein
MKDKKLKASILKDKTTYAKEMSLRRWAEMFRDIYFPSQNYGRSAQEIFIHLVKVFGGGSHYLFRVHDPAESRKYIAKIFAWYCALASRLGFDIEELVWSKYPGICPRCLKNVCKCSEDRPEPINQENLSLFALENATTRPQTLRDWQTMFANIYRGPSGGVVVPASRDRLSKVFARMAEELGEVASAMLQDPAIDPNADFVLRNEMADFGAWIFALANNLHLLDETAHGVTLADVAWDSYPGKCHRCQEPRCVCVRGSWAADLAERGAMGPSQWDERTGLANDAALRRYIREADTRYREGKYTWSLIFLDLDHFGMVNKKYNHFVGDQVLRLAATYMLEEVGNNGIVFRRGGEEFVLVLRVQRDPALRIAETIRRRLEHDPFVVEFEGKPLELKITASMGVASCMSDEEVTFPRDLEALAEGRAKEAKAQGRNRVVPEPSQEMLIRSTPIPY